MKKLPTYISVLGHTFTIKQVPKLADDGHGECNVDERTIKISTAYPLASRQSTLRHEAIHAILGITGLTELLSDELEEAIVVAIENALTEELRTTIM